MIKTKQTSLAILLKWRFRLYLKGGNNEFLNDKIREFQHGIIVEQNLKHVGKSMLKTIIETLQQNQRITKTN